MGTAVRLFEARFCRQAKSKRRETLSLYRREMPPIETLIAATKLTILNVVLLVQKIRQEQRLPHQIILLVACQLGPQAVRAHSVRKRFRIVLTDTSSLYRGLLTEGRTNRILANFRSGRSKLSEMSSWSTTWNEKCRPDLESTV
jgi:hypothetical protein